MDHSKNKRAARLMGLRRTGAIILDQPCELGYHCPICEYPMMSEDGQHYDERLHWSEYNSFIWCEVCNFDYPSALCMPDPKEATEIFLDIVDNAIIERIKTIW